MQWWVSNQDITNNRTLISWEIGVQGTAGRTSYWYSNSIRINSGYIDGALVCGSQTFSNITLVGDGLRPLRSGSIWVGHASDGSKSFGASMAGWFYGGGDKSTSGSWALPTIPRGADPSTDKASYTIGEPIVIYTNRKSSSFTHTVRLEDPTTFAVVRADFNSVGDSVTWTPTADEITLIQSRIPNSNTYAMQIAVFNNQVGEWRRITRNLTLTDANPTFTDYTYKDANTATATITGSDQVLVKGKSTLQVDISTANKMTANKGSTASHYAIAYDGTSEQKTYSPSTTVTASFATIATIGSRTLRVTAFDSRNNATAVDKSITVYDYKDPTITTTLTRENNFDNNTTIHIEGTYTPLVIGGVNKNALTVGSLQYRYKETGGTFGSWVTKTFTANTTEGTFTLTDFVVSLDNQKKFEFEFKIADKFGTVTTTNSVDVGTPIMFVGENSGVGAIGINKMPENGALDVAGDIYSNGNKVLDSIPDGSVTSSKLDLSKTTVDGWTVMDYGTWKEYNRIFTFGGGASYASTVQALPTGFTMNDFFFSLTPIRTDTSGAWEQHWDILPNGGLMSSTTFFFYRYKLATSNPGAAALHLRLIPK